MNLKGLAEALKVDLSDGKYNFLVQQRVKDYGVIIAHEKALEIMILDRISELVKKVEDN